MVRNTILIFFVLIIKTNAQILKYDTKKLYDDTRIALMLSEDNTPINLSKTKGSPYTHDKFLVSIVEDKILNQTFEAGLRYNIYNDEVEFIDSNDNKTKVVIKKTSLIYTIGNESFVYLENESVLDLIKGYYKIIIQDEKASLYLKYTCKYSKEVPATPPLQVSTPAKFSRHESYYIQYDKKMFRMPRRKKAFLNIFPEFKGELSNYMKSNSPNLKDESDLIKIITFINSNKS